MTQKMEIEIKITNDGSHTLYRKDLDENYHSTHGAVQESNHVFIKNGLDYSFKNLNKKKLSVLEVGFGTGLNCFLSYLYAKKNNIIIEYSALETNPLNNDILKELNYCSNSKDQLIFNSIHSLKWNEFSDVSSFFKLNKIHNSLQLHTFKNKFDLVYFDAFGPRVEAHLWKQKWYDKIKSKLNKKAVFVTYCAKGQVRRDLKSLGFTIERLDGPPGKREMIRGSI